MKQVRQAEIDRENRLLLRRLESVYKDQGRIDNWNLYKHHRYVDVVPSVYDDKPEPGIERVQTCTR